jgi:hypothetical protein
MAMPCGCSTRRISASHWSSKVSICVNTEWAAKQSTLLDSSGRVGIELLFTATALPGR